MECRFDKEIKAIGVLVPCKEISEVQKAYAESILMIPKIKCVRSIENDETRKCILLRSDCPKEKVEELTKSKGYEVTEETVRLGYDNLSMSKCLTDSVHPLIDEVLKELLPSDIEEIPSGFETIGDIAHLNLTGRLFEDYRYLIGEVVMDKNPIIRTVVTKIGQIESTYRFYDLECIAGDASSYETLVLEDKVRFTVDVSKVYWCSKLGSERNRMIEKILNKGEVLCDMFCGIGPLAVKAAVKKQIKVIANDLNPSCYEYLQKNIQMNKVGKLVIPFNMDARAFVRHCVESSTDSS